MSGRYLTDMADVLRAAGCDVEEVAGWQTRARSSGGYAGDKPYCIMWHHTASNPGTSAANNVSYIIRGSSVAPIANLYLHHDGKFYVCAAGATNTNGKGGPLAFSKGVVPLDSMNTCAIGIEAGNSGVGEPWPQVMIDAYFKGSNALAAAYGMQPADLSSHQHYAPNRKIDPATALAVLGPWQPSACTTAGTWDVTDMRTEATRRARPPEPIPPDPTPEPIPPTPGDDDDMKQNYYVVTGANAKFIGVPPMIHWTGPGDQKMTDAIQKNIDNGTLVVQNITGGPMSFALHFLEGPLPTGDTLYNWTGDEFANTEQIKAGRT